MFVSSPLFFVVSGYFFHSQRLTLSFVKQKFSRLIIPSFVYSLIHAMLSSNCKINFWLKLLYGGRAIGGVYWYSTCLFCSYILMAFIVSKYTGKMRLSIIGILCVGGQQ
ncbi:acyltransferase family protein [Eisenbergiella sp.]